MIMPRFSLQISQHLIVFTELLEASLPFFFIYFEIHIFKYQNLEYFLYARFKNGPGGGRRAVLSGA